MEGRRQALFGTCAFLLALHGAVQTAKVDGAGQKSLDINAWLTHLSRETFYGQSTTPKSTSSLLGMNAYCLKMTFLAGGTTGLVKTLLLSYIDASNRGESTHRANASLDIKPLPPKNVAFNFTRTANPKLMGRTVKYELLKTRNINYTFCSILQTSKGQPDCSYWVLVMSRGGIVPDWCQPDPIEPGCKVEIYTLKKHEECGYASEEEEEDDDDESEESDSEEDEDEEDDDEEDDDTDCNDEDGEENSKDEDEDEENESGGESKDTEEEE
ncbi:putative uncharacterized transmembrane protein DDB_G0290641 [Ixodes scapularis]|uniref:putative uncharacterized transmembrane protein DDB_G0290641 n=1 Tax=Ixodes scapularis TaxID=6945 RepID=UPI001C384CDE|nr:putative uncharacterized transmembrane protein DDB_G0290641 [Ixodes scapularis]